MDESMEKIQVSLIYLWNLAQFLYAFNMNKAFLYCKDYYRDFNSCYSKIFNNNNTNTDETNDNTLDNNDQNDNNTYEENDGVFIQTNMQTIYSKINILLNKEKSL